MGNPLTTARLTVELAKAHRVLMLGGLAVISHGHSRPTFDADVWLDPSLTLKKWFEAVFGLRVPFPEIRFLQIGTWQEISDDVFAEVIGRDGVFRLMGASQPLDIFRAPNELPIADFDEVWDRATPLDGGIRLPSSLALDSRGRIGHSAPLFHGTYSVFQFAHCRHRDLDRG